MRSTDTPPPDADPAAEPGGAPDGAEGAANGRNERRVMLATALASGMTFIDQTAINTALPVIQAQLGGTVTDAQWIVEVYMLFLASLILAGGALGDKLGRRKVFRWGVVGFAVTSLACGLAQTTDQLIAARTAQGVAAALLTPSSLALLNASFPRERRGHAVGAWAAITSLMIPLGPGLGGAFTDFLSWHWIFYINVPISLVCLVAARGIVRPRYDPPEGAPLDAPGAVSVTVGLGGLTFALLEAPRLGPTHWSVLLAAVVGLAAMVLFFAVERRREAPMLPLGLLRRRSFAGINLATLFLFGGFMSANVYIPFMFIQARGYSALEAGACLLPLTVAITVISRYSGRLVARVGRRPPVIAGPALAGTALLLIGLAPTGGGYWAGYFPWIVLLALGMGLTVAPWTTIAMNAAGEGRSGLAAGVNNAVARTGQLTAVAVLGLLLVPAFQAAFGERLADLALPESARAALAAESLKLGALDIPAGLDAATRTAVEAAARTALLDAFALAMAGSAVLMWLAAWIVWRAVPAVEEED